MDISRVMTRDFIRVNPDHTLREIEHMMDHRGQHHAMVMDADGVLVGVVSDRDIRSKKSMYAGTDAANARDEMTLQLKAHQFMTRNPVTVHADTDLEKVVEMFLRREFSSVPVVDDHGRVVGVATKTELLHLLRRIIKAFN